MVNNPNRVLDKISIELKKRFLCLYSSNKKIEKLGLPSQNPVKTRIALISKIVIIIKRIV